MSCHRILRDSLIRDAKAVAASVRKAGISLSGTCIVRSLAAGDFTPGSDVDMLLISADGEGKPDVLRRLVSGRVCPMRPVRLDQEQPRLAGIKWALELAARRTR